MMPMFLHRSNGTVLDTAFFLSSFLSSCSFAMEPVKSLPFFFYFSLSLGRDGTDYLSRGYADGRSELRLYANPTTVRPLPAIVSKRLVGFGHAVHVFLLLDGRATVVAGVEQFIAQLVDHAFFRAAAGISDQPADRQRGAPVGIDFHRDLVIGATHTTALHFEQRLGVFHGFLEQLQGLIPALLLQLGQGFVKDAFRRALLALPHHGVDELGHQIRSVHRIVLHFPLGDISFSRHVNFWLLALSFWL